MIYDMIYEFPLWVFVATIWWSSEDISKH